jgi:uncharacterized membrane protein
MEITLCIHCMEAVQEKYHELITGSLICLIYNKFIDFLCVLVLVFRTIVSICLHMLIILHIVLAKSVVKSARFNMVLKVIKYLFKSQLGCIICCHVYDIDYIFYDVLLQ